MDTAFILGTLNSYIAIYKPGIKFAPYQRSYAMSGHVNHVGIVVDDLDEIEQRVRSVGFEPHMHANYEPGRRFYFYDDTGLEIEVVSYNS